MAFSIELLKDGEVSIKLQAVKNTISFYFKGTGADKACRNCIDLEDVFIRAMPGYNMNFVRGPDASHLKRNHTSSAEIPLTHFHSEFITEITPEFLSLYLHTMLKYQKLYKDERFKFFEDASEVNNIIFKYSVYYADYKGSSTEELYEEQTTLTDHEEEEFREAAERSKLKTKASFFKQALISLRESSADSILTHS